MRNLGTVSRTGRVERVTKESSVLVEVDLDGTGRTEVATGVPFFDHMLDALGKHGALDLVVRATGDVEVEIFNADVWAADGDAVVSTLARRYVELVEPHL